MNATNADSIRSGAGRKKPVLAVVVPCYNEEEVLPQTGAALRETLWAMVREGLIAEESYVLFVDDGSRDRTWSIIASLAEAVLSSPSPSSLRFYGLKLAKNAGHQAALLAGYRAVRDRADAVVSIDADLQDDVSAMREMVLRFLEGYDVVYGVRRARETDRWFKRTTARAFYRLMRWMGAEIVSDHADYRLLSRRALRALLRFREANLFLRGLVPLIGFRQAIVRYDRRHRAAGESKYPLRKMLALAVEGITSFSVRPIRFVTLAGLTVFAVSALAGGYTLWSKLAGHAERGWTSLMLSLWFLGGLMLLSIGLVGEYIGKIYLEAKRRPRYIVEAAVLPPRRAPAPKVRAAGGVGQTFDSGGGGDEGGHGKPSRSEGGREAEERALADRTGGRSRAGSPDGAGEAGGCAR